MSSEELPELEQVTEKISDKVQNILDNHPGSSLDQISASDVRARLSLGFAQAPLQENYFPTVSPT